MRLEDTRTPHPTEDSTIGTLDRGELWHPLSEDKYRELLYAEVEDLEAMVAAIEGEWYS